jgi:hypothetical protein
MNWLLMNLMAFMISISTLGVAGQVGMRSILKALEFFLQYQAAPGMMGDCYLSHKLLI